MNGWTKALIAACLLVGFLSSVSLAASPANVNPPPTTALLEIRANQAFNRGQYNTALPILQQLSETFQNQPERLGPIQEKIRVCEAALASIKANPQPVLPPPDTMPAKARTPHAAPKPGEVLEMGIKDLGNFKYDADRGANIPADVQFLSGCKLRLRGFMIPMDQAQNITQFALVPSLYSCCFLQPPGIQHTVVVTCPKGKAVNYCADEIVVEGTLKVEEKKDEDYIVSIFELTPDSVKPRTNGL